VEDAGTESILLNIDSPGGELNGVSELAAAIYQARASKPVWAYVDGEASSGAYWLAAATRRIVAHETSRTGSIGVIASILDDTSRQKRRGVIKYDIVSSQSPYKRADPSTETGHAKLQALVDDLADIFIADVARYRGITPEHVIAHYGQGFVMTGARALTAGMVDELSTYEGVLERLEGKGKARTFSIAAGAITDVEAVHIDVLGEEGSMADQTQQPTAAVQAQAQQAHPAPVQPEQPQINEAEVRAAAVQTDRARIKAILGLEEARGCEDLARHFAFDMGMEVEAARVALSKVPKAQAAATVAAAADQFAEHMRTIANPKVGVTSDNVDDVATEVRSIIAFLPANQRRVS